MFRCCGYRLVPRILSSLVPCLALLMFSGVQTNEVFFASVDDPETVVYCPTDIDTFKIDLANAFPFFGTNFSTIYMSTPGYLTDTFRPNLENPMTFPMNSGSSFSVDCEGSLCWVHYYYTDEEVLEIESQNYVEECVNGMALTETYDIESNFVYDLIEDYGRTLTPEGCISETVDNEAEDYNWMIAAYWQNLDARHFESLMWYRETTDSSILIETSTAVTALGSADGFAATVAVIFTWSQVSFLDGFQFAWPELDFQVTLVTDGSDTYAIYNYKSLTFAAGQAGFDAGDMSNYCGLHYSRSNLSHTWADTSNIGVPGRWVMKLGEGYDASICEPLRADVANCLCDEGWEGRICASSIDDCVNHDCPAEAVCVDGHLAYTCDFCDGVTCENEGVCVSDEASQSYQCDCVGDHTGDHCRQCVDLSCDNGGLCSNNATSGESTCTCAEGYSGSTCQISNADSLLNPEETQSSNKLTGGETAGIVVGSLIGLLVLIVLIVILAKYLTKKKEVEPERPDTGRNTTMASHA